MDSITRDIKGAAPESQMFPEDMALAASTIEELQAKLKRWVRTIEQEGFKVNWAKTKYTSSGARTRDAPTDVVRTRSSRRPTPAAEERFIRRSRRAVGRDRRRGNGNYNHQRLKRKKGSYSDDSIWDWKAYDKRFWNQYWLKFSGVLNLPKMPLAGNTRMLRARRKDINLKPNRRLDRKSSKGMLFENEELRMRTIAINTEVEQGQQALKKLRRENELLRREVWTLRDENDKMERILQTKDTDEEESDQENSQSEGSGVSEQEEEEEEEEAEDVFDEREQPTEGENPDLENEENLQKSTLFAPRRESRAFDGLSVIDEQTEETQTTDGYGNSRGNSQARTTTDSNNFIREPYNIHEATNFYPPYHPIFDPKLYKGQRKRGGFNENGIENTWGTFGVRPSSPYPYTKAAPIPSYEHRFNTIAETHIPTSSGYPIQDSEWHGGPSESLIVPSQGGLDYRAQGTAPLPPTPIPDYPLNIIRERMGPDVFTADAYSYLPQRSRGGHVDLIGVESELSKIEISQKSENCPMYTGPTENEPTERPSAKTKPAFISSTMASTAFNSETMQKDFENSLVSCQIPSCEDTRQIVYSEQDNDVGDGDGDSDVDNEKDKMPRPPLNDRSGNKSFQSKLSVTLRFPETGRIDRKSPQRSLATPLGLNRPVRFPTPLKHEVPRLQAVQNARTNIENAGRYTADVKVSNTVSNRNATVVNGLPEKTTVVAAAPVLENKPVTTTPSSHSTTDGTNGIANKPLQAETPPGLPKTKTPPAPPPRTTSCPSTPVNVPTPPIGVTALHHRTFRKGKSASFSSQHESDREIIAADSTPPNNHSVNPTNPLMMTEPIATSSPTLRHKFSTQKSVDSQRSPKLRKQSSVRSMTLEETTDDGGGLNTLGRKNKAQKAENERLNARKLRKQSQISISSLDNTLALDRRGSRFIGFNNVSISSSSGLDSPTKSDRRKRRVSIKFNKKTPSVADIMEDRPGILTNCRSKSRCDDTDGTTSDRERTNSVSSRTSSMARRKLSTSSTRTVFHEEKIPWCGCWGNGCV